MVNQQRASNRALNRDGQARTTADAGGHPPACWAVNDRFYHGGERRPWPPSAPRGVTTTAAMAATAVLITRCPAEVRASEAAANASVLPVPALPPSHLDAVTGGSELADHRRLLG
jgi:hypothetical protein